MATQREIIFLNRAYNDTDIQMSLVDAFAADGRFKVRVIGFPADGDIGMPDLHEAVPYMKARYGISFENIMDTRHTPWALRALYRAMRGLGAARRSLLAEARTLAWPLKAMHIATMIVLRRALRLPQPWMCVATAEWNPAAIIIDEIYAQPGRSYMTDVVLPGWEVKGVPIYMIQTGHNIYRNPAPSGRQAVYRKTGARTFFMPSALDREISCTIFPEEKHEVAGNLRMDMGWLARLKSEVLALPYYPITDVLADLPRGKVRVAIMLSKMSYGVQAEALKDTIRTLAHMDDVALVIKPHTRGMKFDFMHPASIRQAFVADHVPSAVISEWADIVLFTGSSVAYHAMLRGKTAGFLKYCQRQETVFDGGATALAFDTQEALEAALLAFTKGIPFMTAAQEKTMNDNLRADVYAGDATGQTAQRHRHRILADIGLLD